MTQQALPTRQTEPVIKITSDPGVRVCYNSSRAISTIVKMADGKYQVIKLYEGITETCDTYRQAADSAKSAAMTQQPRSTVRRDVA